MRTLMTLSGCALLSITVALAGGCGKDDDQPDYHELSGRVTDINEATGEVGMSSRHPKTQVERPYTGKLAPNAEILINGRTASLKDVLIGDNVTVRGRIVERGQSRELIANYVEIDRPEALDLDRPEESEDDSGDDS